MLTDWVTSHKETDSLTFIGSESFVLIEEVSISLSRAIKILSRDVGGFNSYFF